jgi:hypothetical protein
MLAAVILVVAAAWFGVIRDRASEREVREKAIAATGDRTMTCHAQDAAGAEWFCWSASGTDACARVRVSLTGTITVGRLEAVCEGP